MRRINLGTRGKEGHVVKGKGRGGDSGVWDEWV